MKSNTLTVLTILLVTTQLLEAKDVKEEFEEAEIVPDVTNAAPTEYVQVEYTNVTIDLGNELTPAEASAQPHVEFDGKVGTLYTLVFADPDAPNRLNHTYRNYRHWVVVNIPGPSNIDQGDVASEYVGPAPGAGGGLHRYTLLVFEQEDTINVELDENRRNFDVKQFAQDFKLSGPLYGNYFKCQNI